MPRIIIHHKINRLVMRIFVLLAIGVSMLAAAQFALADGFLIWRVNHNWWVQSPFLPTDVTADMTGVYVVGEQMGTGSADDRWFIKKHRLTDGSLDPSFDTDGLVIYDPNTSGLDPIGIAVHSSGIYVVGREWLPGPAINWRIVAWNLDGTLKWEQTCCPIGFMAADSPMGIAVDNTGVYAIGSVGSGGSDNQWRIRKWSLVDGTPVAAFDGDGELFVNPSNNFDWPRSVSADGTGLYVAGDIDRSNIDMGYRWRVERRDPITGALDPTFGVSGVVEYIPVVATDNGAFKVRVTGTGVYLMANESLGGGEYQGRFLKWNLSGTPQWDVVSNPAGVAGAGFNGFAVDGSGVHASGVDNTLGSNRGRIEKRSLIDGSLLWAVTDQGLQSASAVAVQGLSAYVLTIDTPGSARFVEKRRLFSECP